MVLPRQKDFNCFQCKFYAPNPGIDFQGHCARQAPTGENGLNPFPTGPATTGAELVQPSITWCGDFEKWMGEPREEGTCPYSPPVAEAQSTENISIEDLNKVANDVMSSKEAAETAAASSMKFSEEATASAKTAVLGSEGAMKSAEIANKDAGIALKAAEDANNSAKTATNKPTTKPTTKNSKKK